MLFFVFFCLRRVAPVSALFWPVAGLGLSRALLPLYMFALATLGRLSPCRRYCAGVSGCRGFPAVSGVGVVGVVGLFVCVIAWLSSSPSVAGCRPVAVCGLQAVAVCAYPCQGVRLSNKCSIRAFRTNFRNTCSTVVLPQSVRISDRI